MSIAMPALQLDPEVLRESDVERSVIRLIKHIAAIGASDLFIEQQESDTRLAARHQGLMREVCSITREEGARFINHLRAIAGMPMARRHHPSDGRWVCQLDDNRRVDLRINTIPTLRGEDMTIRVLDCSARLLAIDKIGYHAQGFNELTSLLTNSSGLILVSGPSGAGKSTTLYACLNHLNNGTRKINTIEDPVEYELPGVRQSQVHPEVHLGFSQLLRAVLRQAPDVIMIGEIRDAVTAKTAVLAANSGHLVLATLHAPFAASSVNTMLALSVQPRFLATSLLGAISQRLVRTLCPNCRVAHDISGAELTFEDVRPWLQPGEGNAIYTACGCPDCQFQGFQGRTMVAEVFTVDRQMRQMIHLRRPAREMRALAVEQGMVDLRRAALLKAAQGLTSIEELMRVIPSEILLPDD